MSILRLAHSMDCLYWAELLVSLVSPYASCLLVTSGILCLYSSGHYLDQRRLKQGLYRHPWDDISYLSPDIASSIDSS